jgi:hypothetical protein
MRIEFIKIRNAGMVMALSWGRILWAASFSLGEVPARHVPHQNGGWIIPHHIYRTGIDLSGLHEHPRGPNLLVVRSDSGGILIGFPSLVAGTD